MISVAGQEQKYLHYGPPCQCNLHRNGLLRYIVDSKQRNLRDVSVERRIEQTIQSMESKRLTHPKDKLVRLSDLSHSWLSQPASKRF